MQPHDTDEHVDDRAVHGLTGVGGVNNGAARIASHPPATGHGNGGAAGVIAGHSYPPGDEQAGQDTEPLLQPIATNGADDEADEFVMREGMDPTLGFGVVRQSTGAEMFEGSDRPSPLHLVAAVVGGLVLIGFAVFLWVGPSLKSTPNAEANSAENVQTEGAGSSEARVQVVDADELQVDLAEQEAAQANALRLTLGDVWISKCEKPGPGRTPASQCDRQPWFEQALVRAVKENESCAIVPGSSTPLTGRMSVVMRVDYAKRSVDFLAGKSGSIRGSRAKGLLKCLQRSIPQPEWDALGHEHVKYLIAVMATYGADDTKEDTFE